MQMITVDRLVTTMVLMMLEMMMTMMVMMMKWKAGVGPPYAKQLSLSVSAATRNLKLEGSC